MVIILGTLFTACARTEAKPENGQQMLEGIVFEDVNSNGVRDEREKGLARVRVSNGRDIIMTDVRGRWHLPAGPDDTIFVIKPRNWISPLDENGLPQFFYVHNPDGSPDGLKYRGVEPTPNEPGAINFPLHRHPESSPFSAILLGDPQSRNLKEVDYLARDVIEPMVGGDAAFGVGLGDLAFDDLNVLPAHNMVVGRMGIPWFNVHGNHDINFKAENDRQSDETWQRLYGPPTYSFDWGTAHFIVIDDVVYDGDNSYHGALTEDILTFVEADLKEIGKETLVVLLMHIPLSGVRNADDLLRLIADRPNVLAVTAHYHMQRHEFMEFPEDTGRREPLHHLINGTACGSWWRGEPDEYGIPHSMMQCGAPNGCMVLNITDFDYSLRFMPAKMDPSQQMHVFLPGSIPVEQVTRTEVVANVWAGSSRSTVRMRIDDGNWIPMIHSKRPDPYYEMAVVNESLNENPNAISLPKPKSSPHIWVADLPPGLEPGGHVVEVESTDMFGQIDIGNRIFRITDTP
tara:strand:- start:12101 stop:13648 length:1548 start_codon:yes stop_codon:yes gene_type:complete